MDRPEPGLVKWSPNSAVDSFVHINLQHRVVQLYEPTGYARKGRFDYEKISRHDDFPPLTTYDWSPQNPGFLAVGTGTGIVNLLKIDDGSNAYVELGLKVTRTCQAVAFNTTGLLAVGLDRVRMDQSLHIWDVNRLSTSGSQVKGFPRDASPITEPRYRLEPTVSVSSIKFFEDSPQTLIAGIKTHGVRIHDLREPAAAVTFQTKCTNNLAIDYADQNYFASSALDTPGVLVWDRRATSRPVVSASYLQAVDEDELPLGAALRLDRAIETDSDPSLADGKHSLIRSLRFCRDSRGLLAVLSRTGQLRLLQTNKEILSSETTSQAELLHVHRSHELDVSYRKDSRKNDRIVSFDWLNLGSPVLRPRVLILRANGSFDILEQPSNGSDHLFKLVSWKAPHRGLEAATPYLDLMKFETSQASEILAPLVVEQAQSSVPIFGSDRPELDSVIEDALKSDDAARTSVTYMGEPTVQLPDAFHDAPTTSEKLRALRAFLRHQKSLSNSAGDEALDLRGLDALTTEVSDLSLASNVSRSCREIHETLLSSLITATGLPPEAQNIIDHAMLLRAKERYLFDPAVNRNVVSDDPWTRFAWDWVADAADACEDGSLVLSSMDLSYLGVRSIWMNDLGRDPSTRLAPGASQPDTSHWERYIGNYCKKRRLPKFDGVATKKPHHRQLCLEMCRWGDAQRHDPKGLERDVNPDYPTAIHTLTASRALFRGDTKQAIEILKKASAAHPELLFVSLALQLMGRGGKQSSREQLDLDAAVASRTDPFLQAMSSLIATGDWSIIANQRSLPLADRACVAVRNFTDEQLTAWLDKEVSAAVEEGDIEGIALTGITDSLVDIFARYIQKFNDVQTAILILSICYPRYIDDVRCRAWRNAYRSHLQRHKLFFQRTKFEVESTKRSKRDGAPTLKPPSRQIALRCVYCDAETSLARHQNGPAAPPPPPPVPSALETRNPLLATSISAGVSCPNCGRHLPRCVVCLEVVGVPRSDRPEEKEETRTAARFPTFCLKCEHVLHLDHARQWFSRHAECPVPECRCRCNFRANPELHYR